MTLPAAAVLYFPLLVATTNAYWPTAPEPWIMAAQVEKETCRTLTHKQCWSPRAELKTSRENGIGFGQATRAYNANGTIRFDKISELRAANPEALKDWTWDNRYDPVMQMRGLVLANSKSFKRFTPLAATPKDAWRFTLAGYNGGDGSVLQDRLRCKSVKGCDPKVWYGNVEIHSGKSRVKWQGYGESAYDINRGYVKRIESRAPAYKTPWEKQNDDKPK